MIKEIIKLPSGVSAKYDDGVLRVSGPKGEIMKRMIFPLINFSLDDDSVVLSSYDDSRGKKKVLLSFASHVKNMIKGVTEGYTYKLKVCFSHFPMTPKVSGDTFLIDNFIGEKKPRTAKNIPGVDIIINDLDITLTGIDKEKVSQMAARIEKLTRVKGYDRRVFQDGIYIVNKAGRALV